MARHRSPKFNPRTAAGALAAGWITLGARHPGWRAGYTIEQLAAIDRELDRLLDRLPDPDQRPAGRHNPAQAQANPYCPNPRRAQA